MQATSEWREATPPPQAQPEPTPRPRWVGLSIEIACGAALLALVVGHFAFVAEYFQPAYTQPDSHG